MNTNLSSRQWQLLSAYLDKELNEKEILRAEELLRTNLDAKNTLEALRQTRAILKAMPMRRAPRDFTLAPQTIRKPILPSFDSLLRFSSAIAAFLLLVVLALDILSFNPRSEGDAVPETLAMKTSADQEGEAPVIIFWGGAPAPVMGIYGKGGAGPAWGIGGGAEGPGPTYFPREAPVPEALPPLEPSLPGDEIPPPIEEALPEAQGGRPPGIESPSPSQPLTGSGPILGVRPKSEQGQIRAVPVPDFPPDSNWLPVPLLTVEIVLAGLMVLTAGLAWILRRRRTGIS